MKLRSLLLAGAATVLLPVGGFVLMQSVLHTAAFAQSPAPTEQNAPKRGMRDKKGWGNQWQEQLNLSADQKAKIKTIHDQEKSSSQSLRQQIKAAAEKEQSLMAGTASDDQLRQQHREMQTLHQQMETQRFETMLKIRAVLTPEQRTKAAQFQKEHRGHHRGGPGEQAQRMMRSNPEF
jgi:periplasmic protein CpxP/Spy